jgi:hypothetical protein
LSVPAETDGEKFHNIRPSLFPTEQLQDKNESKKKTTKDTAIGLDCLWKMAYSCFSISSGSTFSSSLTGISGATTTTATALLLFLDFHFFPVLVKQHAARTMSIRCE